MHTCARRLSLQAHSLRLRLRHRASLWVVAGARMVEECTIRMASGGGAGLRDHPVLAVQVWLAYRQLGHTSALRGSPNYYCVFVTALNSVNCVPCERCKLIALQQGSMVLEV
jgi:hypothetical protein